MVREHDVVARVGGDEFALLAVECDEAQARAFVGRVREALERNGIRASVGVALRSRESDLSRAWHHADERMYEDKHGKHQRHAG